MSDSDRTFATFGDLELPVRAADISESGLAALDPSRDLLLELFQAAINADLGEAFAAAREPLGYREQLGELPVSDVLPGEPTEQNMRQRVGRFPLLALHRSGVGQYAMHTLELGRLTQPWSLHYILGPLDIIEGRQLKDICVAVAKVVATAIRKRGHQAFMDGALQFFGSGSPGRFSPLTSVRIVSHEGPGQAVFGDPNGATMYWAIEMQLETTELLSEDPDAEGDLESTSLTVAVGGSDEGTTPDFIIVDQDV